MIDDDPTRGAARLEGRTLTVLLLAVTLGLGWILLPFYGTILWAGVITLLSQPLFTWLLRRTQGRRNLSAALTMLAVLLVGVLPLALVAVALAAEAMSLVAQLQSGELEPVRYFRGLFDALPAWVHGAFQRLGVADFDALQRRLVVGLVQGGQVIAGQAFSIGQDTFGFAVSVTVTLYLAFFLVRDGQALSLRLQRAVPLAERHQRELLQKFRTVIRATVKGNLLVALIQGSLGGLAFWVLDVRGPLLWAVLMAFLSLLPAVGAALVWFPVAMWFLMDRQPVAALALAAWGVLVIGLVDNLLRPMLVGKDTRMPDYVVMMTTLGGMAVFGINGFVIGPVIAAMFIAVWHIQDVLTTAASQPHA